MNDVNVYRISEMNNTLEKEFFNMVGNNDKID